MNGCPVLQGNSLVNIMPAGLNSVYIVFIDRGVVDLYIRLLRCMEGSKIILDCCTSVMRHQSKQEYILLGRVM